MTAIGARVLITEDCRKGGNAAGQTGVYEGDFPLTVVFGYQGQEDDEPNWKPGEYSYEAYRDGSLKMVNGEPASLYYLEWERGKPCPRPLFAMPYDNPRIRLEDGSIVWGCECWWTEVEDGMTLETAKAQTEETKDFLRTLATVITKETT